MKLIREYDAFEQIQTKNIISCFAVDSSNEKIEIKIDSEFLSNSVYNPIYFEKETNKRFFQSYAKKFICEYEYDESIKLGEFIVFNPPIQISQIIKNESDFLAGKYLAKFVTKQMELKCSILSIYPKNENNNSIMGSLDGSFLFDVSEYNLLGVVKIG